MMVESTIVPFFRIRPCSVSAATTCVNSFSCNPFSPAGSGSGQWYPHSAPGCLNQRRRNPKTPGCRLLLPLSLRRSSHTDFAADTAAAWSPADRVCCRALLYNSTAKSAQAIPSTGRSARSGQETLFLCPYDNIKRSADVLALYSSFHSLLLRGG